MSHTVINLETNAGCRRLVVGMRGALLCALALNLAPLVEADDRPEPAPRSALAETEGARDAQDVRRELDDILSQPAFRRIRHQQRESDQAADSSDLSWLARPFKWLWDWLKKGSQGLSSLGGIWLALAYTGLAVICALIIWLIVRAVNSFRRHQAVLVTKTLRTEEGELDLPPGDVAADEYRRRAAEFAAAGRYREAIGQLILGSMSWIERNGLIRFRRGLTHRDYLRSLRGREMNLSSFRAMVAVYEPICFGRRPALQEHFRAAEAAYATGFESPLPREVAQAR